jgi:ATP-dependent helicase/nuclease subunit B
LDKKVAEGKNLDIEGIKRQFEFWFDRRRYDLTQQVPKSEAIHIFDYLSKWAIATNMQKKTPSLLVLATQAEKIKEFLEELPERDLSNLELERIIRTIYKPSPVVLEEKQVGAWQHLHAEGAFANTTQQLVWWNFIDHSSTPALTFWRREEINFLAKSNIQLENKEKENRVLLRHAQRPILATSEQLLLLIPATINGKEVLEHPLMGYLHATFDKGLSSIVFDLDNPNFSDSELKTFFRLSSKEPVEKRVINGTASFIEIPNLTTIKSTRDYESLTSLEDLLYYPYKWAFKYKAKLSNSAILSVAKDSRLMGNLAHRAFELILEQNFMAWSQNEVNQWIKDNMPEILRKEGAPLLMYGKEQEREMFYNRLRYAIWSLISMIKNNNWKVVATEQAMNGIFCEDEIRAKADLILERGEGEFAVIDLKWSGISSRREMLSNQTDLQLVMYAALLEQTQVPHTAFFIIDKGKMLARNGLAFKEAEIVNQNNTDATEIHHSIYHKMSATYRWRKTQLTEGKIEVRTSATKLELEKFYEQQQDINLLDMLEMKDKDAPWDEYNVVIQGVK